MKGRGKRDVTRDEKKGLDKESGKEFVKKRKHQKYHSKQKKGRDGCNEKGRDKEEKKGNGEIEKRAIRKG